MHYLNTVLLLVLVKRWMPKAKLLFKAADAPLGLMAHGTLRVIHPFTNEMVYCVKIVCRHSWNLELGL